jgi:2'-5' RNA ligase
MRLFLAIELPDDVREHLVRVQQAIAGLAPKASLTKPENLHVTLKFLGEVDERRTAELCDSLAKVTGAVIELSADRLECFPTRGPLRIIAAGMRGSEKALAGVHGAIEQRCRYLGFESETRRYRPHVTLARAKGSDGGDRRKLDEASAEFWPGPSWRVGEFVLMQSRLRPQGAEYVVAARFPLAQ